MTGARCRTGGLAVTRTPYRVVDARGRPDPDIHAPGVATGNTGWFTEVGTGRPGRDSPFRRDADAVAAALLGQDSPGQDSPGQDGLGEDGLGREERGEDAVSGR
ncbi:hypothetical protein [Nonomuraea sp. NPDC049758]|uniref:hypothetical protein n=1 Tax=Nonomuraea sp. NPDC049758 TaxID=3154360 RepID=UPI00343F1F75